MSKDEKEVEETKRLGIFYTLSMLAEIDEYRRNAPGLPDRTNAIRELIKLGLEAYKRES